MFSYIGLIFLSLTFVFNILTIVFFFNKKNSFNNLFYLLIFFSLISIIISFLCLIVSYIISDFTNYNVFQNSHSSKPILYKISGAWGNHEGSMLLWLFIMNLYSYIFTFNNSLEEKLKKLVLVFQSMLYLFFSSFVILTSNPFLINNIAVSEGLGLNPILQDPALAIHPPVLYIGYVGFSLILSLALAGMVTNKIDKAWVNTTKKWSIFCWSMLTGGIALGSYWAYYELGWGGWWFWDPVENVSLMPWIAGLALVHSLMIINKEPLLKRWIIFLSILCFSLTMIGTFLVRSGILTSVHTFATDTSRGIFILLIFLVITGFSFLLFIIKAPTNNKLNLLFLNKTSALIINNLIMTIACATILLGTIYPIIIEVLTSKRISVGSPYYNNTVLPILLPGFLLMSIAPVLSWESNKLIDSRKYVYIFISLSMIVLTFSLLTKFSVWGFIGIFTGCWIILGSFYSLFKKFKVTKKNMIKFSIINNALIAHIGVGILILGITFSSVYQFEYQGKIKVNEVINLGNYELKFDGFEIKNKKNFQSLSGNFSLLKNSELISKIKPEKRLYYVSKTVTTEAGIYHHPFQDFYIVLGEKIDDYWTFKYYQNPLVSLIWLGSLIMVISGIMSLRKQ